jgi:hypothetical protein
LAVPHRRTRGQMVAKRPCAGLGRRGTSPPPSPRVIP